MPSRMRFVVLGALACLALSPATARAQDPDFRADSARAAREGRLGRPDSAGRRARPRVAPPAVLPGAPAPVSGEADPARQGGSAQPDSMMQALAALEGYKVTRYTGSAATFRADSGAVELLGPATIDREGQNIAADSLLTFDRATGVVCGYGSPVLSGEGAPISSDQICYDTERRLGMALGARTEFQQNATWYVHGERVFTAGSDRIYSAGTEFTSCDLEIPHYHFTASRFKMVNEQILVARDVTLSFGDVPVFWLPFLVQNLRQGRRSGLLTPSFGLGDVVQTSDGHTRQVRDLGFFWAINDYTGAELAMDWRSGDWFAVRGLFEYRWTRQFLAGSVNARQFFRESGRELALNSQNRWQPGERTQVGLSAEYVTSSEFVRRESYDPAELNRTLGSDASIQHRFRNGAGFSLGASRDQQVMAERVTTILPRVSVNVPSVTLASPLVRGEPMDLVWTVSGLSYSNRLEDRDEDDSPTLTDRDGRSQTASAGHSLRFGNLTFTQGINGEESDLEAKPAVPVDTTFTNELPAETTRRLTWNTALSYQQNLIGTLRVTPQLSLNGQMLESPRTGNEMLGSPVTLNFGAAAAADIYGFWPGVGPFERFRHKISPNVSYTYRPAPDVTEQQDSIFGADTRATNAITLSFAQTFEAKRPAEESGDSAGAPASDDLAGNPDEPRQLPGQQPIRVLSIETSAIAYDFEAASRGQEGLTTTSISNRIASDLLRNLSVTVTHSLFDPVPAGVTEQGDRHFDLHLDAVNAGFGLSGDSWLFRLLGLGGETSTETAREAELDTADVESLMPESDVGMIPGSGSQRSRNARAPTAGSRGTWRADFTYSLQRPRDTSLDENQQLNTNLVFQPTQNWSATWNAAYSVTDSEFRNHSIRLTRALHEWQAEFTIHRAQNGNFSFEFEARLNDLPDLRIPYDQRTRGDQ